MIEIEKVDPREGQPKGLAYRLHDDDGITYCAYKHPHPAAAATVALFDRSRGTYLLIRRENEPFAGTYVFPGGFLDVGREDIRQAAARELAEEAEVRIDPDDLILVDVRSAPDRDPRDHVLDIAFYAETEKAMAQAGDEATEILWAKPDEIDRMELGFDHGRLWEALKKQALHARPAPNDGNP